MDIKKASSLPAALSNDDGLFDPPDDSEVTLVKADAPPLCHISSYEEVEEEEDEGKEA